MAMVTVTIVVTEVVMLGAIMMVGVMRIDGGGDSGVWSVRLVMMVEVMMMMTYPTAHARSCTLKADAFESFCGDLAITMATAASYPRAARRLRRKCARRHSKSVRSATPRSLARHAASLRRRSEAALERLLRAEVELHEDEAVRPPAFYFVALTLVSTLARV